MVTLESDPREDRGQLILIGAIAIALIVVGVVLVVNTALFTEVVGSEGTVETAKESGVAVQELTGAASAVVHQANLQPSATTDTTVDSHVDDELDRRLLNTSLDGRGAYTSVEYVNGTTDGTSILQQSSDTFEDSGGGDWEPVPSSNPTDVGHFVIVVDVSASGGTLGIDVDGQSDSQGLDVDASATDEVVLRQGGSDVCTVPATSGTVRIDLRSGVVYETGCQFDLFDGLEPGYSVTFTDGDQLTGQYRLVTEYEYLSVSPPCNNGVDCHTAIWSYNLEYTYDTGDVVTEGEREVTVYD